MFGSKVATVKEDQLVLARRETTGQVVRLFVPKGCEFPSGYTVVPNRKEP